MIPAMDLNPTAAWQALAARDARFDGRLFVGVTSTGIYCRPVCRVTTPQASNCRFFANAPLAEQAGFRPCLRCRPELAPGLSLVDSPLVLARHAAALIDRAVQAGQAPGMSAVAARLGVTDRHLRRVFTQAHGVSPVDYLSHRRLLQAKQLLTDTDLPVAEVALACGFESPRRLQALLAERCRLTPSQLRQGRRGGAAPKAGAATQSPAAVPAGAGSTLDPLLEVRLGYRPPYDIDSMLAFWAQRALPGVETVADGLLRRTLRLPGPAGGPAESVALEIAFLPDRNEVRVRLAASGARHWAQVIEAVRQALDLDADPQGPATVLEAIAARHPGAPLAPGLRVPGSFDGFETAVRVILGQQVTVAAARTLAARLVQRFGPAAPSPWPGVDRAFPDAATLAAAPAEAIGELGIVRQRVGALQALARAVLAGLPLHRAAPLEATREALLTLPGIGDWSAELLALRCLGWPDAFPASDIGVLKALGLNGAAQAPEARAAAEPWRPWRSYAVIALWRALEAPG